MKVCYVSNTAGNSGAPKMLGLVRDWFRSRFPRSEESFLFPLDSHSEVARRMGRVFYDAALTFPERVALAEKMLTEEAPDLIVVNTLRVAAFGVAARKLGVPCILYAHEMGDTISFLVQRGYASLDVGRYLDLTLWASKGARDQWAYLTGHTDHSMVLESCFTEKLFSQSTRPAPTEIVQKLAQYRSIVMSVGTICLRKGFDRFIDLAAQFPSVPFVWVGGFDGSDPTEAQALKVQADSVKNVAVTGDIADPKSVLALSTLVLFLSREDPNPLTIHEAVHHGFKHIAVLEGLGETRVPLASGGAVLRYDPNLISRLIDQEVMFEANVEGSLTDYRIERNSAFKAAYSHLVRREEHFFDDLDAIQKSEPVFSRLR